MSFDLYFYKRTENKLSEQDFADYLNKNLPFNISEHPKQWDYENEETGVYFLIDWNEPNTEQEVIEIFDSFSDYTYLNFSCSINFFRPRYFGLEIFPIIDKLVKDLDLFVLNPQDESNHDKPIKYFDNYIRDQWIRHNDKVTLEQYDKLGFKYFALDKSNYMWWYMFHRQEIQDNLKEDVFIAGYFLLQSNEDNNVYTVTTWTNHIPCVLPLVDYIIIQKNYKRFFKTVEETGLVSYSTIMDKFGNFFKPFNHEIPDLKIIHQKESDLIEKDFNNLKVWKTTKEFGSLIGKDGFVNIENIK